MELGLAAARSSLIVCPLVAHWAAHGMQGDGRDGGSCRMTSSTQTVVHLPLQAPRASRFLHRAAQYFDPGARAGRLGVRLGAEEGRERQHQDPLRWVTAFLVLSLILDFLQYFVAGWVWRTISYRRELDFYSKRDAAEAATRDEAEAKLDADHAAAVAAHAAALAQRAAQKRADAQHVALYSDMPPPVVPERGSLEDEARTAAETAEQERIRAAVAARARFEADVACEQSAKIAENRWHRAPAVVGYYAKVIVIAAGYAMFLVYAWKRFF